MQPRVLKLCFNLSHASMTLSNATRIHSLTALVPFVVFRNFYNHRCRVENLVITGLAKCDYAAHRGLATQQATGFSQPADCSVRAQETERRTRVERTPRVSLHNIQKRPRFGRRVRGRGIQESGSDLGWPDIQKIDCHLWSQG